MNDDTPNYTATNQHMSSIINSTSNIMDRCCYNPDENEISNNEDITYSTDTDTEDITYFTDTDTDTEDITYHTGITSEQSEGSSKSIRYT